MRIAVSGTACVGKSTFVSDFLDNWKDIYKTPVTTYRDILTSSDRPHSKKTCKDTQLAILNMMVDEHMKHERKDNVIFDRCPVDNLVYSIHAYENPDSDIDEDFINECIPMVKESMRFIDILFYIPYDEGVKVESNGSRETDATYIKEVDNLLAQVEHQSLQPTSVFFHGDDRPAVITLTGNPKERIRQASLYVTDEGESYNEGDSDIDWEELAKFNITPEDVFPGGRL